MQRLKLHRGRGVGALLLSLLAATLLWLPCLHLIFRPRVSDCVAASGTPRIAAQLAALQLRLWSEPALRKAELDRMRLSNAEWDFMARTYLVMALANIGLREPESKPRCLDAMDRIIGETLRLEKEHGKFYFLMDYARSGSFLRSGDRSLFEDGEIAMMLAARRYLEERPDYRQPLAERVDAMVSYMEKSPVQCGESYPNECWMFCNTVALAVMRMADGLDGTDHSAFVRRWVETARRKLTDPATGMLISSFSVDGDSYDGPEGSSIWMVAHCLQVVDPAFAADQYKRARAALGDSILGFGYAREWPASWQGEMDVDSGPVLPILRISAGSSGLAILGAASFGDTPYLRQLLTSLEYGGFPSTRDGRRRYCAANTVGDAVVLYALVQGPLWENVLRKNGSRTETAAANGGRLSQARPADLTYARCP